MVFDITFLMLCSIGQNYGLEVIIFFYWNCLSDCEEVFELFICLQVLYSSDDESDHFFINWYTECMVENNTVKNPDTIINRCDQTRVEMLTNQYLQGDPELKTWYS
jgi:hypothetical protein